MNNDDQQTLINKIKAMNPPLEENNTNTNKKKKKNKNKKKKKVVKKEEEPQTFLQAAGEMVPEDMAICVKNLPHDKLIVLCDFFFGRIAGEMCSLVFIPMCLQKLSRDQLEAMCSFFYVRFKKSYDEEKFLEKYDEVSYTNEYAFKNKFQAVMAERFVKDHIDERGHFKCPYKVFS